MAGVLMVIGLLGIIGCVVWLIVTLFTHHRKRWPAIGIGIGGGMFIVGLVVGMITLPESTSPAARSTDRRAQETMAPLEIEQQMAEERAAEKKVLVAEEAMQAEEAAKEPEGDPELAKRTHAISLFADVCAERDEVVRIARGAEGDLAKFWVWIYPIYYLNWNYRQTRVFAASLVNQSVARGADFGEGDVRIAICNADDPARFRWFPLTQSEYGRYE